MCESGLDFQFTGSHRAHFVDGAIKKSNDFEACLADPIYAVEDQALCDWQSFQDHRYHEGHAGLNSKQVLSNLGTAMLQYGCKPTCAFVHLGTNDIASGASVEDTIDGVLKIITKLKDH